MINWAFYDRAVELEGRGDLAGALSDISKALELDPKNGNCIIEHGVLLFLLGKEKEANTEFDVLRSSDTALWQKRIDQRIAVVKEKVSNSKHL